MRANLRSKFSRRLGFTAIELAAVASIIAILALILLPIVRKRVDAARITAAMDDMKSLETAEVLANADAAQYFRLCDLDNPALDREAYLSGGPAQKELAAKSIPNGTWNTVISPTLRTTGTQYPGQFGSTWNGPYTTFNKTKFELLYILYSNPAAGSGPRFREINIDIYPVATVLSGTGPMPIFRSPSTAAPAPYLPSNPGTAPYDDDFTNQEEQPVDPWGFPYIFFGPGLMGTAAGPTALSTGGVSETNWGTAVLYTTGPDGIPGSVSTGALANPPPQTFFRELGVLGTGDDLYRVF